MTNAYAPALPKWKCHKVVSACKIGEISQLDVDKSVLITPADSSLSQFITAPGWYARYQGSEEDEGYFVEYDDGFQSWSPSKAFEEGYAPYTTDESRTEDERRVVALAEDYYAKKQVLKDVMKSQSYALDDRERQPSAFSALVLASFRTETARQALAKLWTPQMAMCGIVDIICENTRSKGFPDLNLNDDGIGDLNSFLKDLIKKR